MKIDVNQVMLTYHTLTSIFLENQCERIHIIYNCATLFMLTSILSKTNVNLAMLNPYFLVVMGARLAHFDTSYSM